MTGTSPRKALEERLAAYDNRAVLEEAVRAIRSGFGELMGCVTRPPTLNHEVGRKATRRSTSSTRRPASCPRTTR